MLVVEEETGGNGSLALALDRDLAERYQTDLLAINFQSADQFNHYSRDYTYVEEVLIGIDLQGRLVVPGPEQPLGGKSGRKQRHCQRERGEAPQGWPACSHLRFPSDRVARSIGCDR